MRLYLLSDDVYERSNLPQSHCESHHFSCLPILADQLRSPQAAIERLPNELLSQVIGYLDPGDKYKLYISSPSMFSRCATFNFSSPASWRRFRNYYEVDRFNHGRLKGRACRGCIKVLPVGNFSDDQRDPGRHLEATCIPCGIRQGIYDGEEHLWVDGVKSWACSGCLKTRPATTTPAVSWAWYKKHWCFWCLLKCRYLFASPLRDSISSTW